MKKMVIDDENNNIITNELFKEVTGNALNQNSNQQYDNKKEQQVIIGSNVTNQIKKT